MVLYAWKLSICTYMSKNASAQGGRMSNPLEQLGAPTAMLGIELGSTARAVHTFLVIFLLKHFIIWLSRNTEEKYNNCKGKLCGYPSWVHVALGIVQHCFWGQSWTPLNPYIKIHMRVDISKVFTVPWNRRPLGKITAAPMCLQPGASGSGMHLPHSQSKLIASGVRALNTHHLSICSSLL